MSFLNVCIQNTNFIQKKIENIHKMHQNDYLRSGRSSLDIKHMPVIIHVWSFLLTGILPLIFHFREVSMSAAVKGYCSMPHYLVVIAFTCQSKQMKQCSLTQKSIQYHHPPFNTISQVPSVPHISLSIYYYCLIFTYFWVIGLFFSLMIFKP